MIDFLGKLFGPLADLIGGVLEMFHSMGAPWWLSIALLTILVRTSLFPLTVRQVKNMRAMQELKPEMDELRSRYKDDRHKQQEKLMELYRERRVNPLAGFVPILIQIPVFVTMYRVIRYHEENFPSFTSGGLLWFSDLTRADPYLILPVLSASVLLVSMEISSKNADPGQKRMMRLLPLVFTVFIARFPAGLFVYWVTSNAFTLVQNYLIYHRDTEKKAAQEPRNETASASIPGRKDPSPDRKAKRTNRNRRRRKRKKR